MTFSQFQTAVVQAKYVAFQIGLDSLDKYSPIPDNVYSIVLNEKNNWTRPNTREHWHPVLGMECK